MSMIILFLKATQKGYLFAAKQQIKSIEILNNYLTEYDKATIDISKSLDLTTRPYFGNERNWPIHETKRIDVF
jgi:hypothetical protein